MKLELSFSYIPNITRKMLHHPGASLSEWQNASEMSAQPARDIRPTALLWLHRPWAKFHKLFQNHELARESLLCRSGHAKHLPEANLVTVHSLSLNLNPNPEPSGFFFFFFFCCCFLAPLSHNNGISCKCY